jgi:hypothetical protein
MQLRIYGAVLSALVCAAAVMPDAMAQRRDRDDSDRRWVELGCREVSFSGRDRDTIRVGRREGRFRAIRLAARGSDIEVVRLEVVYANGVPDELDVRRVIRRGDRTGPLELRGRDRTLQRIAMVYRQRGDDRGRATVCAEGLVS